VEAGIAVRGEPPRRQERQEKTREKRQERREAEEHRAGGIRSACLGFFSLLFGLFSPVFLSSSLGALGVLAVKLFFSYLGPCR
jgi:hypothetical protein